jgi:outer membrane protein assembly factor BamB
MDTGDVLWQAGQEGEDDDAGFGPTATANGLVFVGGVIAPNLRVYDAGTGERLHQMLIGDQLLGSAIASGPVIIDGTVLVGTGIGTLTGNPESPSNITASFSSSLVALCVEGSSGCR